MPKLGLPFKKEDFFFNDREKRIFFIALSAAGAAVVLGIFVIAAAAIVTGAVRTSRSAEKTVVAAPAPETGAPPASAERPSLSASAAPIAPALTEKGDLVLPMSLNSFVLSDDFRAPEQFDYSLFRPRTGKWDRAAIERFWAAPRRIGLENLKKINDKNIEDLFEGVQ